MNLLVRLLRAYLRTGWRGTSRVPRTLAQLVPALRAFPVPVGAAHVYMDLRTDAAHRWLRADSYEPAERSLMRALVRPDDVVYDVGANIGMHTASLSPWVRQVHAFEPQVLPLLRRTADSLGNVVLHACALGDEDGTVDLYIPHDRTKASLADWTRRGERTPCRVRRLDDLELPAPDLVKVDVEGAELRVFRGARRLLDRPDAPIVLFEANRHTAVGSGVEQRAALDFLASLDAPRWRFFRLAPRTGGAVEPLPIAEPLPGVHVMVLAVPESRLARLASVPTVAAPGAGGEAGAGG
jgi:FkbM family methyltransferase